MDINKILEKAQSGVIVSSASSEDDPPERNKRIGLHKRRSLKMMGGVSNSRALRAIQSEERRKGLRGEKMSSKRQIPIYDQYGTFDENEEIDTEHNTVSELNWMKKAALNDRREKLQEYLAQKNKLEQHKRKTHKPAFRPSGRVHHDIGPAGPHKPNTFSVGLGISRMANASGSRNISTLSRANSTLFKNTSTMSRVDATRNASAMSRSNSTLRRTRAAPAQKQTEVLGSKAALGARPKDAEVPETTVRRAKVIVSPNKLLDKPVVRPDIGNDATQKSSSGSNSSRNQSTSFAPQKFKFRLSMVVPTGSSSSESEADASVALLMSTPKASTPKVVQVLESKKMVPVISEIEKPTEPAVRHQSVSSLVDDVFTEHKEESDVAENSSTIDMSEIDKEIAKSAMKNRAAKKLERSQGISCFGLNEGICDYESSQDETEVVAALQPEKAKNPDEDIHQEENQDFFYGRTTRRSIRVSGVKPDTFLTEVEINKTPAQRAKTRSRCCDRKSKDGQCLLCSNHTREHYHSDNEARNKPLTLKTRSKTPTKTPGRTQIFSRKSTLPVLSEKSPSKEDGDVMDGDIGGQTNRSAKDSGPEEALSQTDTDEGVSNSEERMKRKSKSSLYQGKDSLKGVASSTAIDTESIEMPQAKQSIMSTLSLRFAAITEGTPTPVRATRWRGRAIEDLAKNFENAPLTSAKKPVDKFFTSNTKVVENVIFKTPNFLVVRSVVKRSQSASKIQGVLEKSPWIDFGRRTSSKKRKSLSEEKPRKSDLSTMFDDIPDDSTSPIHEILARKVKCAEDLNFDVETELKLNPPKQIRLDAQFDLIAEEQENEDKNKNTGVNMVMDNETKVRHLGNIACTADVHFDFFRKEYEKESKRIDNLCNEWVNKVETITGASEEVFGQIRSVIGQGRIMIAKKGRLKQFETLVENCEFQLGEQKTTCMDLKGFWDMVYFQVEDIDNKFENLRKLEAANWIKVVSAPVSKIRHVARKPGKKLSGANQEATSSSTTKPKVSKIQKMMAAQRAALAAEKKVPEIQINAHMEDGEDPKEEKTFDAGFFAIKSPVRWSKSAEGSPLRSEKRKSRDRSVSGGEKLRRTVLTESARRLSGFSPIVSAMSKRSMSREAIGESALGETSPVKDSRRSSLFENLKEDDKNDENDEEIVEETPMKIPVMDTLFPLSSVVTKICGTRVGGPAKEHHHVDDVDSMAMSKVEEGAGMEGGGLNEKYFRPGTPTDPHLGNSPAVAKWSTSSGETGASELMKSTEINRDIRKINPQVYMLHFESPP